MDRCSLRHFGRTHVAGLGLACFCLMAPAHGEPRGQIAIGDTSNALPGIVRVPFVATAAPRLAMAFDAGYGYTESQDSEGVHHRIIGQLGVGSAPLDWLELGIGALGRHDRHPDDGMGKDTGTTADLSLVARVGQRLGSGLRAGVDLGATFPGSEHVTDALRNPALDARILFGWVEPGSVRVAGFAGYRLDRREGIAQDRDSYRPGDRLALGISGFDAVLAGLGLSVPLGSAELLAEMSGDVLVGSDAPGFMKSPLRADVGARFFMTPHSALQALLTTSLSERPKVGPGEPLVAIEPRFTFLLGFRHRFYLGTEATSVAPVPSPKQSKPVLPQRERQPETKPVALPHPTTSVEVRVVDKNTGHPLSDAVVELIVDGETIPLGFVTESTFRLEKAPVGTAELVVRAERMHDYHRTLQTIDGRPVQMTVEMTSSANSGQIRGLIRGFDGNGLVAQIRIQPGNREFLSDSDGAFRVDVAPGTYRVEVTREGHRSQRLEAVVDKDGVVVLNVDLIKGGP